MPSKHHRYPRLWVAGRAAALAVGVVTDKVRKQRSRSAGDVPGTASEITAEWLTSVLCPAVAGARVTDFTTPGGSSGTSERVALRMTYNQAGREARLPEHLFAKLTASLTQRLLLGSVDVISGETHFFMRFRPKVDMEAPLGYWGAADDRTWKSIVIMEDIAHSKGATFSDPTTTVTRSQVEDLVQNMARYHGAMWEDPDLAVLKTPTDHANNVNSFISMGQRCAVGMERAKSVIAPGVYGQADRLWKGTLRSLALNTDTHPRTLLHGDSHIGQTYTTADGRMGLTDWQATMQGGWGYDFAYLVGSACEPEDRRAWDRELLELYLERLSEHGGKPPTFDDAWLIYRQQLFYPYSAWAFTIGRAFYQPKMQPDERSLAILRRLSVAIDDNRSFEAIGL
jgi:Phosphotransferase enzyme family